VLEVAVSNGLGRARRRIFPAGAILVYKTCRPIRAICAVHPHRRDVRAGSLEFRSASTLVWLAAEVIWVQEARRDRRLDAAWMEGVAACPRMKRGDFQPGSWRADGFLRCVVWGTFFLHGLCVWSRRSCVRLVSLIMHKESDLFAEPGRMEFGIMGTVCTCTAVACGSHGKTTIEHETRRHSTRLPRAPSQCYRWPLTQGGAHGGEYKVAGVSQDCGHGWNRAPLMLL